jgi:hypothetical protein
MGHHQETINLVAERKRSRQYKEIMGRAQWLTPIMLTTWEVEPGGLQFNTSPEKSTKSYLKNK